MIPIPTERIMTDTTQSSTSNETVPNVNYLPIASRLASSEICLNCRRNTSHIFLNCNIGLKPSYFRLRPFCPPFEMRRPIATQFDPEAHKWYDQPTEPGYKVASIRPESCHIVQHRLEELKLVPKYVHRKATPEEFKSYFRDVERY